jgi:hypothetical protein
MTRNVNMNNPRVQLALQLLREAGAAGMLAGATAAQAQMSRPCWTRLLGVLRDNRLAAVTHGSSHPYARWCEPKHVNALRAAIDAETLERAAKRAAGFRGNATGRVRKCTKSHEAWAANPPDRVWAKAVPLASVPPINSVWALARELS